MALGIVFVGLWEMSYCLDIVEGARLGTSIKNLGRHKHACIVTSLDHRSQVFNNQGDAFLVADGG